KQSPDGRIGGIGRWQGGGQLETLLELEDGISSAAQPVAEADRPAGELETRELEGVVGRASRLSRGEAGARSAILVVCKAHAIVLTPRPMLVVANLALWLDAARSDRAHGDQQHDQVDRERHTHHEADAVCDRPPWLHAAQ